VKFFPLRTGALFVRELVRMGSVGGHDEDLSTIDA
jgi:hypothetical protein